MTLVDHLRAASAGLSKLQAMGLRHLRLRLGTDKSADSLDREQHLAHGLAWLSTYGETFAALSAYAETRSLTEMEKLLVAIAGGEYLNHLLGGIPLNQQEFIRPHELGLADDDLADLRANPLRIAGNTVANRQHLVDLIQQAQGEMIYGASGLAPEIEDMRRTMHRFVADKVKPHAHRWHRDNAYLPLEIIEELAGLGVFLLTLPEQYGGLALSKQAMCLVSEELSRGWIAVGSLGTRAEIAAELILAGGTGEQKSKWLPKIASGEILTTAVFTEPNTGSDLGALQTRAKKHGDTYRVTGNKTWITHPVRADLMMLLVRTNPGEKGYKGLSMLLAEKTRGSDVAPYPTPASRVPRLKSSAIAA